MEPKTEIKLFEEQKIRTSWDDASEEWYFSVVDVIEILTEVCFVSFNQFLHRKLSRLSSG